MCFSLGGHKPTKVAIEHWAANICKVEILGDIRKLNNSTTKDLIFCRKENLKNNFNEMLVWMKWYLSYTLQILEKNWKRFFFVFKNNLKALKTFFKPFETYSVFPENV